MPGLTESNEFISRDEGLHCDFAAYLFRTRCADSVDLQTVLSIITEAVQIEHTFVEAAIPVSLIGINAELMKQYICHVADTLLARMGLEPFYNIQNPFEWMASISVPGKPNFFERRGSEYSKDTTSSHTLEHDDDF